MSTSVKPLVVVGVDGSPGSGGAVDWAAGEAHRRGDRLELLYAELPAPPLVGLDPVPVSRVADDARPALPRGGTSARVRRVAGSRARAVADRRHAPRRPHRAQRARRPRRGRRARPLDDQPAAPRLGEPPRGDPRTLHRRRRARRAPDVLGTRRGRHRRLAHLATRARGRLRGGCAARRPARGLPCVAGPSGTGYGVWAPPPGPHRGAADASRRPWSPTRCAGGRRSTRTSRSTRRLEHGHPVTAVIAESERAQLVVLGSHGRGHFVGMDVGSVPSAAIREAQCPVMVVRPERER